MTDTKTIHVGKAGLTDNIIAEIKLLLKKYKSVRVRILKSARSEDKKVIAEHIKTLTNSKVADLRGYTIVLKK